jgi:glycosyltransferase involved in cell wall biosynthesis
VYRCPAVSHKGYGEMHKGIIVTNIPATYRIDLYKQLGKSGYEIFFYGFNSPKLDYCRYKGEMQFPWSKVNLCTVFLKLMRARPKMVICINASHVTLICALYCFLFRKRFIIWWAGTWLSERNISILKENYRKAVFGFATKCLAYSEFAEQYLHAHNVLEDKIQILGNVTLDPRKFFASVAARRNNLRKGGYITILSIANLMKRKNHHFLLELFSEMKLKHHNLKLVLAGDGPEKADLTQKIHAMGIEDVELLGKVDPRNIPDLYAAADIFVHTALMDQWPQAFNEALASKLPAVISRHSGVSEEFFQTGRDLFVLDLNKNDFAKALESLILSESLRKSMGENGFAKATDLYDRSIALFRDLLFTQTGAGT